jgi:hypothetical protein
MDMAELARSRICYDAALLVGSVAIDDDDDDDESAHLERRRTTVINCSGYLLMDMAASTQSDQ